MHANCLVKFLDALKATQNQMPKSDMTQNKCFDKSLITGNK